MTAHFEPSTDVEEVLYRAMKGEQVALLVQRGREVRWTLETLVAIAGAVMISPPDAEGNLERIHDHVESVVHIGGRERIVFLSGGSVRVLIDKALWGLRGHRFDTIVLAGPSRESGVVALLDVTLTPSRQLISNPQLYGTTSTYKRITH